MTHDPLQDLLALIAVFIIDEWKPILTTVGILFGFGFAAVWMSNISDARYATEERRHQELVDLLEQINHSLSYIRDLGAGDGSLG
jgi:hypothetical protein